MRITDVFFAVPGLILAMAFVAALQAVESFTIPLWFGILIPIFFLAFAARSVISESILPPTDSGKEKQVNTNSPLDTLNLLSSTIVLLLAVFVIGGFWQGAFEVSESWLWRVSASVSAILLLASLVILDRAMIDRTSFEGFRNRASDIFDWRNPYRYLTLRTVMIFVAAVIIHRWSGDADGEITVIKEFDRLWKIQVALVFTGWPGYARLIRGQVLYVKEMTFVEAARSVGAPPGRIMFRHILPNAWAPLLVAFTLDIGGTILSASGLSFIGLGAPPLSAEWGRLVSDGRTYFPQAWWLVLFPGLAIAVTTLGFNLLGDGIRDVVDPKNRR
ncbi:MAG: hypothetical protein CMA88_00015 [Euryarchaeota archaeon]|nr:hypothetical protein [Euryarchaeota archaeon]